MHVFLSRLCTWLHNFCSSLPTERNVYSERTASWLTCGFMVCFTFDLSAHHFYSHCPPLLCKQWYPFKRRALFLSRHVSPKAPSSWIADEDRAHPLEDSIIHLSICFISSSEREIPLSQPWQRLNGAFPSLSPRRFSPVPLIVSATPAEIKLSDGTFVSAPLSLSLLP